MQDIFNLPRAAALGLFLGLAVDYFDPKVIELLLKFADIEFWKGVFSHVPM